MSEMKEIALTQGKVALVDAVDYERLMQWKWCILTAPHTFYAIRNVRRPHAKRTVMYMHRLILNTPDTMETDHRNGDGLDNRRTNLRICTKQENCRNRKMQSNNTSGFKGVYWDADCNKWRADIGVDGTNVSLGKYDDLNAAIAVRQAKEREVFGDFTRNLI